MEFMKPVSGRHEPSVVITSMLHAFVSVSSI